MNSKQIREIPMATLNELASVRKAAGKGADINPEFTRASMEASKLILLAEIAAQLDELNENFYRITHPNESALMDAINAYIPPPAKG